MALFRCEVRAQILDDGIPRNDILAQDDALAEVNERVMEQLVRLGAEDPFVLAERDKGRVEFCVAVEAETELDALQEGLTLIGSAIHEAGRQTPGWERLLRNLQPSAELQTA